MNTRGKELTAGIGSKSKREMRCIRLKRLYRYVDEKEGPV